MGKERIFYSGYKAELEEQCRVQDVQWGLHRPATQKNDRQQKVGAAIERWLVGRQNIRNRAKLQVFWLIQKHPPVCGGTSAAFSLNTVKPVQQTTKTEVMWAMCQILESPRGYKKGFLVGPRPTRKHKFQSLSQGQMFTYGLRAGLWRHTIFAYSQFEGVFHTSLQLWARDSQHRTAGTQAKVQSGAVLWPLQTDPELFVRIW